MAAHLDMKSAIVVIGFLIAVVPFAGKVHAQWVQQASGTSVHLTDVVMLDSLTAICVGDSGRIFKTTNAGAAWLAKYGGDEQWNCTAFADQAHGIAVGNRMAIATTTDAGETWIARYQPSPENLLSAAYAGMTRVFIGSDSGTIRYSDDGIAWSMFRLTHEPIISIFGPRGDFLPIVIYVVAPRTAYRSSDLGATWTMQFLPITVWGSAQGGTLAPDGNAFIVGYDGNPDPVPILLRRSPLDTAWIPFVFMPPVLPRVVRDVCAPTAGMAYACGTLGIMFKTIDGGNFWSYHISGTQRNLNAIYFLNEHRGFAVGDSGTILFTSNGGVASIRNATLKPEEFVVYQNYPNPFNPTTTIRFELSSKQNARIEIFDLLGRTVRQLVDAEFEPGSYETVWDGRDQVGLEMSGGVYCFQLVSGGRRAVGSMVFIK
jgi:photosystem II stability/assembly factor-like uncharacterized protein